MEVYVAINLKPFKLFIMYGGVLSDSLSLFVND